MNRIIQTTGKASIAVQLVTAALDTYVLMIPTPANNKDIRGLLKIENMVNIVEGIFYIWMLCNFTKIKNITKYRYYDWMITTPTMLFTYIMYVHMTEKREKREAYTLWGLAAKEKFTLLLVFALNWLMLYMGYLGETGVLATKVSTYLGFVPFVAMFYIIYTKYARHTSVGTGTFIYFATVWALYGFAALTSYKLKNVLYNILDLFAKNFFGLFLAYMVVFRH